MPFNTLTFVLFLGSVVLLTRIVRHWTWRKLVLLCASYVFYSAWNPPFVLLLAFSTVVDYNVVQAMVRWGRSKLVLSVSLLTNLGLLGFFKYSELLLDVFTNALATVGVTYIAPEWSIVLPVGISFYTFQTLSYSIDVYRGRLGAAKSFLDFALFVSFFPQLVAGPIVRASEFLPQCEAPTRFSLARLAYGSKLIVLGLFQKVVLADGLSAPICNTVYARTGEAGFADAWLATFAFACQIFYDFAGYSLCAIGAAELVGFSLPDNFRFPYAATSFSDFWRRWHISLSSWLRDYLYIPLGGNRGARLATVRNLFLTMVLGGLWHGASWRFAIWGGLHGLYLGAERLLKKLPVRFPTPLSLTIVFLLVCVAWVFFRASTFQEAFELLESMVGLDRSGKTLLTSAQRTSAAALTAVTIAWHALSREAPVLSRLGRFWLLEVGLLALAMVFIVIAPGDDRAFIYFQF